jgi:hypothetical protein
MAICMQIYLYIFILMYDIYIYKDGFVPIKLYADTENVRAWPGGTGNAKMGGNYMSMFICYPAVAEWSTTRNGVPSTENHNNNQYTVNCILIVIVIFSGTVLHSATAGYVYLFKYIYYCTNK